MNSPTDNDIRRSRFYLNEEFRHAVGLVRKGLSELNTISYGNDFYIPAMLLLSNGFERFIKCLLCSIVFDPDSGIPEVPYETKGAEGHDLVKLLKRVLERCDAVSYKSKFPAAEADIDFLRNDYWFKELLNLLSEFAKRGRYFYLDSIVGHTSRFDDPIWDWQKIECRVLEAEGINIMDDKNGKGYKIVNKKFTVIFEKFARALSRMFTLGGFGEVAKQVGTNESYFLDLKDSDLGNTQY